MKYCLLSLPLLALGVTACTQQPCCNDYVVEEKYVHRYGVEVPPQDWSQQGRHGQVVTTLTNGVVVAKNYEGGVLQGDTTYSFPHSEVVQKIETYNQNTLVKETTNYSSGTSMKEVRLTSPNSQEVSWWYENGTPRANETFADGRMMRADYYNYSYQIESKIDDGQGQRIMRDPYGLQLSTDEFKDGILLTSTTYHPNGAPKESIPFNGTGIVHGVKKTYMPAGEPKTVEEWVGNKKHGVTTIYQNGEKVAEVPYENGKKNGIERRYRAGETIVEEVSWRNDIQDGSVVSYVGGKTITNWFYQGRAVTKLAYDKYTRSRS